jgi:hypothetical protein
MRKLREKPVLSASLPTTNPKWTGLSLNWGLWGGRLATNCLRHCMAILWSCEIWNCEVVWWYQYLKWTYRQPPYSVLLWTLILNTLTLLHNVALHVPASYNDVVSHKSTVWNVCYSKWVKHPLSNFFIGMHRRWNSALNVQFLEQHPKHMNHCHDLPPCLVL